MIKHVSVRDLMFTFKDSGDNHFPVLVEVESMTRLCRRFTFSLTEFRELVRAAEAC